MPQRRTFIKLLGGAAATWPLSVRAQQPALPVIGFLGSRSPVESTQLVAAFREGLTMSALHRLRNPPCVRVGRRDKRMRT
jgi:putative ABC transport system substrate-binding protein